MKRTYVIGDIHGGLKALEQILERAPITSSDHLIFLGDYCDGWSETPQLLDYLIALNKKYQCTFVMGNHDEIVLKWLRNQIENPMWLVHGGASTKLAYQEITLDKKNQHIHFLENLKPYYLDKQNRLFAHAGFTNVKGVEAEFFQEMLWWDRSLWEMAMCLNPNLSEDDLRYPKRLKLYKEIFIGHSPTIHLNSDVPLHFANVWNVDTGAAFTGKLTIMDIDSKAYWQSDALPNLYPKEKGRN